MDKLKLTIQSCGGSKMRFRFGINISDSSKYFKKRWIKVIIIIGDKVFITKTTCGQWYHEDQIHFKKGFDLYSAEISEFIISQNLNKYEKGNPKSLYFNIKIEIDCISLKII